MFSYSLKIPYLYTKLFPSVIHRKEVSEKKIFLSFDDGPHPEITPRVLTLLDKYNAKATFFCLGKNLVENPNIAQMIIQGGHRLGNHTFSHENAWKIKFGEYINSIEKTQKIINELNPSTENIFRPPYGKITPAIANILKEKEYQVFLWSWILGDYKKNIHIDKVLKKLIHTIQPGDILVLHDQPKSFKNLKIMLPKLLYLLSKQGYIFEKL